jgi:glycerol transport system ATP-binding protein
MNFLNVSKTGPKIMFGGGQSSIATGPMANLTDGRYIAGFRANHVEITAQTAGSMSFDTKLVVTELTGSETFVHLDHGGEKVGGSDPWGAQLAAGGIVTRLYRPKSCLHIQRKWRPGCACVLRARGIGRESHGKNYTR